MQGLRGQPQQAPGGFPSQEFERSALRLLVPMDGSNWRLWGGRRIELVLNLNLLMATFFVFSACLTWCVKPLDLSPLIGEWITFSAPVPYR